MRVMPYLSVFFLCLVASCGKDNSTIVPETKHEIGEDAGCAKRVWVSHSIAPLTSADEAMAYQLLDASGIDHSKIRIYYVYKDTFSSSGWVNVSGYQNVNGLAVFSSTAFFRFKDGQLISSELTPPVSTTLDTIPSLTPGQLRTLFARQLIKNPSGIDAKSFADSCISAHFGYYDVNSQIKDRPANLVKAWHVNFTPSGTFNAYFKDDGTLISFSGGIIVF